MGSSIRSFHDSLSIDVTANVNNRELGRRRPEQPRLGGFWDIPQGLMPSAQEINYWEDEFSVSQLAGIAVIPCDGCGSEVSTANFLQRWLNSPDSQRIFISYCVEDLNSALGIIDAAHASGMLVELLSSDTSLALAGELYSTAGRRLIIDSAEARRLDSKVTEFVYLGQRSRRGSDSLFQKSDSSRGLGLARNEPAVFLKESLGDEYNQSTIEEIIVPGGVALGETAKLDIVPVSMRFANEQLTLVDDSGKSWKLPEQALAVSRALFDFVERSEVIQSDAIVDIDENRRVSISSAFRDTDVGYEIMQADTQPFEYISNLPVTKSVIIDTFVKWMQGLDGEFYFTTEFEVRFLSADNMRIAQTRAALAYEYNSRDQETEYLRAWGREARRLSEKVDYAGLGNSVEKVAHYAGWAALFRKLKENNVPFLHGRYQFMKLTNEGRLTPARY